MLFSKKIIAPLLITAVLISGCDLPLVDPVPEDYELVVPAHFPPPPIPEDNRLTIKKVTLGKKLFFDPILSVDSTVSCGSCHAPHKAFSDSVFLSKGVGGKLGARNAMPLINLVYSTRFFWDGANPSLEEQAIHPIINPLEMASKPEWFIPKLEQHPEYPTLFQNATGGPPTTQAVVDALACFERTLLSTNSRYDLYAAGDSTALTPQEIRGFALFNSELGECFHCHSGYNFTDGSFQNNGLYENYGDLGRMEVTGSYWDEGKFKVPTLRNVEFTGPYMHDGSLATLEDVINHYASGGKNHRNKNIFMNNITLNEQDKQDIVAFMKALSDESFIKNPEFRP